MAEILQKWHNLGEPPITPKEKVIVSPIEFTNYVSYLLENTLQYSKLKIRKIYFYEDIINYWDLFVSDFSYEVGFEGKVEQKIRKNPEKPKDFIENYQELRDIYDKFYSRLV